MSTPLQRSDIRNFAIVAHIDHGKTTLVDSMLSQSGIWRENEARVDRVMDSNDQERERGITIMAKNTAITYKGVKLNILDTPGHADFGGEVERVLTMADGVILLVDAAEGPLPQTRFVLQKAFACHLKPIVVINKIDRPDARPAEVLDEVYDLFIDLGADEDALDFPVIYAIGRDGVAKRRMEDEAKDLHPLFDTILETIPPPADRRQEPLRVLISNTEYDDYVGRVAVGRVVSGTIKRNQPIWVHGKEGKVQTAKVMRLYTFEGLGRKETEEASSGDIMALAGVDFVNIGDTITGDDKTSPLERIEVDPPTLRMVFWINNSPFAGKEGKYVTSRQVRERLMKAAQQNVAIRVRDGETPDQFEVAGRGELQLAVLVESMRREGYEVQLSKPEVVTKEIDGALHEPMEKVFIDVPEEYIGVITEKLATRKGAMSEMTHLGSGRVRLEFRIPSRGLIGFRSEFLTDTRGTGIMNSLVDGWAEYQGKVARRPNGAMVSDRAGKTTPYALFGLQPRGRMFIGAGVDVYEGMIIGEHAREADLDVNVCREKKLTNIRAAGKDENVILSTPKKITIESAIEWIDEDELVEVTPKSIRVRKKQLKINLRPKRTQRDEE
ncbi:MAG: translational GTPase TypA [Myxococcales bacterium]|nr:translational GTPase TypA [Myxococcales bacterium]MCB9652011.1 translational GTPase TypA [Deltaproteobacteria bacterium]